MARNQLKTKKYKKHWVLVTDRMPQSGKLQVLNLVTGQKSGFSPHRGDSLHRFTSNLAGPTGTCVRLAVQNFLSIARGGGNAAPKYQTFPLFRKESPRRGDSLDRFRNFLGAFICPNYLASVIQIWHDSLHRFRSYCWETARRSIRPNFSVHPVGKTMLWI